MIRRVDRKGDHETTTWICKDRRKGKKGNGCKNLILPEEEVLEALTEALGYEWNGVENADEKIFEKIKVVKVYEDGTLDVELHGEAKTA